MNYESKERGLDADCTLHQDKFKTLTEDTTSKDILFFPMVVTS